MSPTALLVSLVIISKINECPAVQLEIPAYINSKFTVAYVKDFYEHLLIIGQCKPKDLLRIIQKSTELKLLDQIQPLQLINVGGILSDVIRNIKSLLSEAKVCLNQKTENEYELMITCLFNTDMRAVEEFSASVQKFVPRQVSMSDIFAKVINLIRLVDAEDC